MYCQLIDWLIISCFHMHVQDHVQYGQISIDVVWRL